MGKSLLFILPITKYSGITVSVCMCTGFVQNCRRYLLNSSVFCNQTWYWAVQVGLLTPLIFAQHRLSPLAAFISGTNFLHSGSSEFANFMLPALKSFLEARSQSVFGNKQ